MSDTKYRARFIGGDQDGIVLTSEQPWPIKKSETVTVDRRNPKSWHQWKYQFDKYDEDGTAVFVAIGHADK